MKPPYPKELDDAAKNGCHGKVATTSMQRFWRLSSQPASFRSVWAANSRWYEVHRDECVAAAGESWQDLVLRVMYENNLGIEVPRDGVVVHAKQNLPSSIGNPGVPY